VPSPKQETVQCPRYESGQLFQSVPPHRPLPSSPQTHPAGPPGNDNYNNNIEGGGGETREGRVSTATVSNALPGRNASFGEGAPGGREVVLFAHILWKHTRTCTHTHAFYMDNTTKVCAKRILK